MRPEFWHQRWQGKQIGFHQNTPTPLLLKHWSALDAAFDGLVFVPLCGKSLDMHWLEDQGQRVLGAELSQLAVEQFFDDAGLIPEIRKTRYGTLYTVGDIHIVCGDVFLLARARIMRGCDAVFDRAALIALPPETRRRYVSEVYSRLPSGCRGLLITLEYPQDERAGPPFSVPEDEVRALFARDWQVELLERRPIPPNHPGYVDGVSQLDTTIYALRKN